MFVGMYQHRYDYTVKVHRIFHRGKYRLGMFFVADKNLIACAKALDSSWSQSRKCWYIDDEPHAVKRIMNAFRGRAWVDVTEMDKLLDGESREVVRGNTAAIDAEIMHHNSQLMESFARQLKSVGYSRQTCKIYHGVIDRFRQWCGQRRMDELELEDVRRYLAEALYDQGYSNAYHRQVRSALQLFYNGSRCSLDLDAEKLPISKKDRSLPVTLSEEEVVRLLSKIKNTKHKVAVAMLYACGLRVGELLNVRLRDLDFERLQLKVCRGKGRKDRYVNLAQSLVPVLKNYINAYAPVEYLLNGQHSVKYSSVSVRQVIKRAAKDAGIKKRVTPHTLRHSFATHLLDKGVNLRHIQELLGHSKPETTMIYTHVSQQNLRNVESPLDTLVRNAGSALTAAPKLEQNPTNPGGLLR
ncbi:MAG: site-specific integrase [Salibacteraceae bacterium]